MSIGLLLQILRSRWLSFVLALSLVLAAAAAITLAMPTTYTASASVVVDLRNDPIAGNAPLAAASPNYLMTQVDIVQSARVATRVVRAMKMTEIPALRAQWQEATQSTGDFEKWLADLLLSSLDVRPSRGSNVINLYYQGRDPQFVAAVANAFVKAYLETVLEMRTGPARDYSRLFDENAKTLRDKLEAAQARLSEYQQRTGLVVSDERLDIETQRLNELNAQLTAVQAAAAETRSRQAEAELQADRVAEVMNNPLIGTLRADLARQESQLEQLGARLGDNHPAVRELRSGVAELRTRLDTEIRRAQSSVGVAHKVNEARVAQARQALEAQRAQVLKLRQTRDEATVLMRDVENAQRAYDGVIGRLALTSLESQANQSSVAALEPASAPNRRSSPRVLLNMVFGLVLGLIAGVVTVWARESRDRRVRSGTDVEQSLELPLLGVLPAYRQPRRLRSARRREPAPTALRGAT